MTIAELPVVRELVFLLSYVMQGIYFVTSCFGIHNIALCIILFAIITKFCLLPNTYRREKRTTLAPKLISKMQVLNEKYENRLDHPLTKNKLNIDKNYMLSKYNILKSSGCLTFLIQLPVLFAIYAVITDVTKYVPALNALPEQQLQNAYQFFSVSINDVPGFNLSIEFLFPILAAVFQLLETLQISIKNKIANNGKLAGSISNAVMLGVTFYFAATFPIFCSLYWITSSIVNIVSIFIIQQYIKSRTLESFEKKYLKKFNKSRIKRGLPALTSC